MTLNQAQSQAAALIDGAVLVLAGAGTGKTTTLVHRTAGIVARGVDPARILSITFTRKAGAELRERLQARIGDNASTMTAGTFHSVARKLLKADWRAAGVPQGFKVIDEAAQAAVVAELMEARREKLGECFDDKGRVRPEAVKTAIDFFSRAKDLLLRPAGVEEHGGQIEEDLGNRGAEAVFIRAAASLYGAYEDRLRADGALDFADLIARAVWAMEGDEDLRRRWAAKWDYVTVDEYQDTNEAQARFLSLLVRDHGNICCVGDDDQAIYGFRGADHRYIMEFEKSFPAAQVVRLEENYRSTPLILAAANAVIRSNEERRGKTLRSGVSEEPCHRIRSISAADDWAEALWIAREVKRRAGVEAPQEANSGGPEEHNERTCATGPVRPESQADGRPRPAIEGAKNQPIPSIFLLYRANWQSRVLEEAMITEGVPYHLHGDSGFYGRAEIRDALAFLQLAVDPANVEALGRIHARPARGVGEKTVEVLAARAAADGTDLFRAARALASEGGITAPAAAGMASLQAACVLIAAGSGDLEERLLRFLADTGYTDFLRDGTDTKAAERVRNLEELARAAGRLATPADILERAAKVHESSGEAAVVTLMTVHAAKGLEADIVFIAGMQEKVFPTAQAVKHEGRAMAEERRLAYVALTRARKRLFLTRCGKQSRFLEEIPPDLLSRSSVPLVAVEPDPPSSKALAFARRLAERKNLELPAEAATDKERCADFLDEHALAHPPFDAPDDAAAPASDGDDYEGDSPTAERQRSEAKAADAASRRLSEQENEIPIDSAYAAIAEDIHAAIERGAAGEYRFPWHGVAGAPANAFTGRRYGGSNVTALWAAARRLGYGTHMWATEKAWRRAGACVVDPDAFARVHYPVFDETRKRRYDARVDGPLGGDPGDTRGEVLIGFRREALYNRENVEGGDLPAIGEAQEVVPLPEVETVIAAYLANKGPRLRHGGMRAYFTGKYDRVHMPPREAFPDQARYCAVLIHECIHSTGTRNRCRRPMTGAFGTPGYAREELVAELGAAFVGARLGLPMEMREDHAAYVASWLGCLLNEQKAFFEAVSRAARAADFFLAKAGWQV